MLKNEERLLTINVIVMIVLILSSIFLAVKASGKDKNEVGLYNKEFSTTLNTINETIDYNRVQKICEHFILQESHINFDWVFNCWQLEQQ